MKAFEEYKKNNSTKYAKWGVGTLIERELWKAEECGWRASLEWVLQLKITSDRSSELAMLRDKIRQELESE